MIEARLGDPRGNLKSGKLNHDHKPDHDWWVGKLTKQIQTWQRVDETTIWRNCKITIWWICKLIRLKIDEVISWESGQLMGQKVDEVTS